jgi:outer membrane lipoprotein carrier protein
MAPRLFAFAFLLSAGTAALAAPPAVVEAFARDLRTLQGQFEQQAFDADGNLRERSQGQVALAAPRQFRWDYASPFPQTIIADGTRLWVYDPDLEQVTVRPQAHEEQSSPLAALIDPAELERQFEVADEGEQDGLHWIALTPRKQDDAGIAGARLGFAAGALVQMELSDALQQRSVIRFRDWQRNGAIPPAHFRFVPPPGVDVVGDQGEDAEVFAVPDGP